MRTTWKPSCNKTKPLTFLFSILFWFIGFAYGNEPIKTYWENGNLMNETHYREEKLEGVETWWWKNGKKSSETHWKNAKREGMDKVWYKWTEETNQTFQK